MQPIDREQLMPNRLYYIECMTEDDHNNIIPNINLSIMVGIFKQLKPVFPYGLTPWNAAVFEWFEISKMKTIKNENESRKYILREVELNFLWRFYEVKKFKIQSDMETRAVNLYLRRIIGDPHFTF